MTMLEYCKLILEKISFDVVLFRREFRKALRNLLPHEVQDLKQWCITTFGLAYCVAADPAFA